MIQAPSFWALLAVAVAFFWCLPARWRLAFLSVASFSYLARREPVNMAVYFAWAIAFFAMMPVARSKRWITKLLIAGIVAYLAYYKYIPSLVAITRGTGGAVAADGLLVPLGISYFVFKLIHYALDVSRGSINDRSFPTFLCYLFLFPIFSAGPIERYDHFIAERKKKLSIEDAVAALRRVLVGVIKKFLIADVLLSSFYGGVEAHQVPAMLVELSPLDLWRIMAISFLVVYVGFSGYCDIAIGASRLFGLTIMENFNYPLLASNIVDFWKRWHMTLTNWCQTYVFMPVLGATRNPYYATYAAFLVIGLWHAGTPHWAAWGIYHATGSVLCQKWLRYRKRRQWNVFDRPPMRVVAIVLTVLFVTLGYAFSAVYTTATMYESLRTFAKMLWISLP